MGPFQYLGIKGHLRMGLFQDPRFRFISVFQCQGEFWYLNTEFISFIQLQGLFQYVSIRVNFHFSTLTSFQYFSIRIHFNIAASDYFSVLVSGFISVFQCKGSCKYHSIRVHFRISALLPFYISAQELISISQHGLISVLQCQSFSIFPFHVRMVEVSKLVREKKPILSTGAPFPQASEPPGPKTPANDRK